MAVLPTIPEEIVIHLGGPDSNEPNVTESFGDYIKNVASSEIYPTWPREAIKANVMAQMSVAINRVYTNYYRRRGYDFDITNSPAYDQTYIYGREIFNSVSQIVDELLGSYIKRQDSVEPLFAQFCDGVEINCDGLKQWESVRLAENGLDYQQILRESYGDDIEIVQNVPFASGVQNAPEGPLREGDTGPAVELMQIRLNRISSNYPGIPKIPTVDGFFGRTTTEAVKKFQEVFNLTPDGIIGPATWNKINAIYVAVKRLSSISSEGLSLSEIDSRYESELGPGDESIGVFVIQYYLSYISLFIPSVESATPDGAYGDATRNAVLSYQRTYGLPETGVVDENTWNSIENTYIGILEGIPFKYEEGLILPFPGRVLEAGSSGDDVRAVQEYLNYIRSVYTNIPYVEPDGSFGPATERAVRAFNELFGIPTNPSRVTAQTWNALVNIYDDLYVGNIVRNEQFPGYEVG